MMRVAVSLAALASAAAFAPISAPTGIQLRGKSVARAPRSAGELPFRANLPEHIVFNRHYEIRSSI